MINYLQYLKYLFPHKRELIKLIIYYFLSLLILSSIIKLLHIGIITKNLNIFEKIIDYKFLLIIIFILALSYIYLSISSNRHILKLTKIFYKNVDNSIRETDLNVNSYLRTCLLDIKDFSEILSIIITLLVIFFFSLYYQPTLSLFMTLIFLCTLYIAKVTNIRIANFYNKSKKNNYVKKVNEISRDKKFELLVNNKIFFLIYKKVEIYNMKSILTVLVPIVLLTVYIYFSINSEYKNVDIFFLIIIISLFLKFNSELTTQIRKISLRNLDRVDAYNFFVKKQYQSVNLNNRVNNEDED